MGFFQRTHVVENVYTCDKRDCNAELIIPAKNPTMHWKDQAEADGKARIRGWSRWHGRSTFYYCPEHGPSKPNPYTRQPLERTW